MSSLDVQKAREHFPSLKSGFLFGENAGGSQISQEVIDRLTDYLVNTNVQLGATYHASKVSTSRVFDEAPRLAVKLFNARSPDEIIFGSSSTLNLENLARGLEADISPGDEFIVTGEHEANVGPWKKLALRTGAVVKYWKATPTDESNPYSVSLKKEDLLPLISDRTRIVAFTACSNILGSIVPVKDFVQAIRQDSMTKGAKKVEISVDCVAYAPHRLIDVQDWDVDFAVLSYYKVYGPHISALYVRDSVLKNSVSSIVHHFIDVDKAPSYKLQPGGPGYEITYATTGVVPYLLSLSPANNLRASFDAIARHEQELVQPLLTFLTDKAQWERGVRVVGDSTTHLNRVPTISFVVIGSKPLKSQEVVNVFDESGTIGIRCGNCYAYTLLKDLTPGFDVDDGVVRISLVHYNTVEEVARIIDLLKAVLAV
ncbi:selenocysteine lyase [Coprinopsis marcescibilis]|uniref:Selenocysteine lyase n=1 Tax=Coprinopsis marcescibilis TaxID=230819 RepID=A0A5C3KJA3_COPMA|nr:selenocysteine lyase [Coprinopsis marcescibilis]